MNLEFGIMKLKWGNSSFMMRLRIKVRIRMDKNGWRVGAENLFNFFFFFLRYLFSFYHSKTYLTWYDFWLNLQESLVVKLTDWFMQMKNCEHNLLRSHQLLRQSLIAHINKHPRKISIGWQYKLSSTEWTVLNSFYADVWPIPKTQFAGQKR